MIDRTNATPKAAKSFKASPTQAVSFVTNAKFTNCMAAPKNLFIAPFLTVNGVLAPALQERRTWQNTFAVFTVALLPRPILVILSSRVHKIHSRRMTWAVARLTTSVLLKAKGKTLKLWRLSGNGYLIQLTLKSLRATLGPK